LALKSALNLRRVRFSIFRFVKLRIFPNLDRCPKFGGHYTRLGQETR
jgi:hypothetical protein